MQEPVSPLSSSIKVCSSLIPPKTHHQWTFNLSCHSELKPTETEKDIITLANVAKKSDAIIHIIPYNSVIKKDDSAFNLLSKVIQHNDCELIMCKIG